MRLLCIAFNGSSPLRMAAENGSLELLTQTMHNAAFTPHSFNETPFPTSWKKCPSRYVTGTLLIDRAERVYLDDGKKLLFVLGSQTVHAGRSTNCRK
ncbi:hypothetical protein JTE90_012021 [Oedothorax gibbosus]|uniref:Uncharacterized protein n=1 Tax=Oedothorax gibbosus TaxID=931172 RepID=A0AAV6TPX8_9ARAC|nr:hypothetical protein JTE90_012021 [Oedothorax gibbosus]